MSQGPFGVNNAGVVQWWGGKPGHWEAPSEPLKHPKFILAEVQGVEIPFFADQISQVPETPSGCRTAPAFTWLSHTGQRQPCANVGLAQKLNNEEMFTLLLLLLLLLPLLRAWFYSCRLSGSHHSHTGAPIKGPNVEGRVWLSPKMSDTNALFMQKAYNAPQFLSSEQITPLSTSATRFFISDTCLCSFSTSEVRWPGCLPEMVAQDKFSSNAG